MDLSDKLALAERVTRSLGVLFTDTVLPMIVLWPDGRFVAANGAAILEYGYSLEELVGMRFDDLLAHDRSIPSEVDKKAREQNPSPSRRRQRRKDGSVIWVVPAAGPIQLEGQQFIVSVSTDLAPILEAEERARAATEAALRDRQIVLTAILEMLRERDVVPALQALARAFAQAVGDGASVWLPEAEGTDKLVLVASHGLAEADASELLRARMDWSTEVFAGRARASRAAQVLVPDEATPGGLERVFGERLGGRCILSPLLGREGAHGLLCGHGPETDDVERALALATMLGGFGGMILEGVQLERRAEAVWQAASERLTDGIALLDRDLRVVRMNSQEADLLGLGPDALGKKCTEVFAICSGHDPCPHRVALAERLHLVRELQGNDRPFRIEIIPAFPNAAEIAIIHVAHDLSDERAMRTRLLTADRLATIGRLSAGVAHEINNPAAFVSVNLSVLRDRVLAGNVVSSDVLSMLEDSLNGMDRIREIVRDLKGFARERSRDVVDLSQVALSAIRIAAHETRGRARVDRALGDDVLARVRGARIAQCVLNLLVNAAQAIPDGNPLDHRIEVRTCRAGDRVRLEVTDTGPGVPDAIKRRIFEPFFTTRESTGGTGLGLWLARGIVEEEEGTITVEDAPERGARFIIELPAYSTNATNVLGHAPAPQTR